MGGGNNNSFTGADPGFQVRVAHLKKLRRAEGGSKMFGVFRVKNHVFTPKSHIFSNFRGACFILKKERTHGKLKSIFLAYIHYTMIYERLTCCHIFSLQCT